MYLHESVLVLIILDVEATAAKVVAPLAVPVVGMEKLTHICMVGNKNYSPGLNASLQVRLVEAWEDPAKHCG